jgi:transcriptional regulator with XRE-family HTH domain
MNFSSFGERLLVSMRVTGVGNGRLAKLSGLNQTTISHFTSGNREPSLDNLRKLLAALPEIDARWLITGRLK